MLPTKFHVKYNDVYIRNKPGVQIEFINPIGEMIYCYEGNWKLKDGIIYYSSQRNIISLVSMHRFMTWKQFDEWLECNEQNFNIR